MHDATGRTTSTLDFGVNINASSGTAFYISNNATTTAFTADDRGDDYITDWIDEVCDLTLDKLDLNQTTGIADWKDPADRKRYRALYLAAAEGIGREVK